MITTVNALDLSEFPTMFLKEDAAETVIIIGKAASAEDVIGTIDIAIILQQESKNKRLDIARLDSEVAILSEYNSIIIGGPCANSAAAKLLGYPENCMEGFEVGKGRIELYEFRNGNIAMLVAGALSRDTRRTTQVLANYKDYELKGTKMEITSVSLRETTIRVR